MKKRDDYMYGPHSYWAHFVCGLVMGGLIGWWFLGDLFDSILFNCLVVGGAAISFALLCGKWGDTAWAYLGDCLSTIFGTRR